MDLFIMKLVTDGLWYLAIFYPLILSLPRPLGAFLLLPLVFWAVWLKGNWKRRRMVETAEDVVSLQIKLLAGIEFFELIFVGISRWSRQCAPFVALFLVSGILLLRAVRVVESGQRRGDFWRNNGIEVAAVLLAAAVVSSEPARRGALTLLSKGYQLLILPILLGILEITGNFLMWLWPYISFLFPDFGAANQEKEMVELSGAAPLDFGEYEQIGAPAFLKVLGIGIVLLAAGAFLYFLFQKFSSGTGGREKRTAGEQRRSSLVSPGIKRDGRWFAGGERNVRYYYRKFLVLCMKKGFEPEPRSTTQDIHKMARHYWDETELTGLRNLYLKARYDVETGNSQEEKKLAREFYRKLKDGEKNRERSGI